MAAQSEFVTITGILSPQTFVLTGTVSDAVIIDVKPPAQPLDLMRNYSKAPTITELRLPLSSYGFSSFNWNGGAFEYKKADGAEYDISLSNGPWINPNFGRAASDPFVVPVKQNETHRLVNGVWKQVLPDGTLVDIGGGGGGETILLAVFPETKEELIKLGSGFIYTGGPTPEHPEWLPGVWRNPMSGKLATDPLEKPIRVSDIVRSPSGGTFARSPLGGISQLGQP